MRRLRRGMQAAVAVAALVLTGGAGDSPRAPFLLGRTYHYGVGRPNLPLGYMEYRLTEQRDEEGHLQYKLETDYAFKIPESHEVAMKGTMLLGPTFRPIAFEKRQKMEIGARPEESGDFHARCYFISDKVHVEITRDGAPYFKAVIFGEPDMMAFDTNCVGQLSLILSELPIEQAARHKLRIFSLSVLRPVDVVVKRLKRDFILIDGRKHDCWYLEVRVDRKVVGHYWMSAGKEKRLMMLQQEEGNVIIVARD